ncbi:MAG TPA: TonB family protein [Gemmatimonadaceae bacterium]|nr:TonB family protein [Gemmatimonadaceae bacterium]
MTSYGRRTPARGAFALSTTAHSLVIAAWIVATLPPASIALDSLANRIYYIPPPNHRPLVRGGETVQYIALHRGNGGGPVVADPTHAASNAPPSNRAGGEVIDSTAARQAPGPPPQPRGDSIYTVLEVDTTVMRSENSAAPAYPLDLLKQHVEGGVVVQYVVDTTGFADTSSLVIVSATNPEFAQSVRDALPYMRFSPAKIGSTRVRQLVQQPFSFRIAPSLATEKPNP